MGSRTSKPNDNPCPARRGSYYQTWTLVHTTLLRKWGKREACMWNFDPRINYTKLQKRGVQPWSTGGRLIKVWVDFLMRHIADEEYDMMGFPNSSVTVPPNVSEFDKIILVTEPGKNTDALYGTVPLQATATLKRLVRSIDKIWSEDDNETSGLRNVNVIGYAYDTLVLEFIAKYCEMYFVVIDVSPKRGYNFQIKGVYKFWDGPPYLMEATISPDGTRVLLNANVDYICKHHLEPERSHTHLLVCSKNTPDARCMQMTPLFEGCVGTKVMAFHPEYGHEILAVGGNQVSVNEPLRLYNIAKKRPFLSNQNLDVVQTTKRLVFSPDGRFISSLVIGSAEYLYGINIKSVLVYSSEDLTICHRVDFSYGTYTFDSALACIFPVFSGCGRYMAMGTWTDLDNENGFFLDKVQVYSVPQLISLQVICRLAIWNHMRPTKSAISKLQIPQRIKDFIMFTQSHR